MNKNKGVRERTDSEVCVVAANDNGTAEARVQSAVLTLARLLGRQIAPRAVHRVACRQRQPADRRDPENRRPDRHHDMTRAALYARYSSDLQSAASIDDQFRVCREHA